MGNFSRKTFDALKHFVAVRFQQGVPLVDADLNEGDEIRKFEIQAFLKWFVGNGVPEGNEGFRIRALPSGGLNTMVLTSNTAGTETSSLMVNLAASTAAAALGFSFPNSTAVRNGSSPARLTGNTAEPFALADGMTLVIDADGLGEETVTFQDADFAAIGTASAAEVAAAINAAVGNLTASPGTGNDFEISGGDGTATGAGRCLVDGRDAMNEVSIKYASQPLYDNAALAATWGVDPVPPLTAPGVDRIDSIYLDLWEREVDEQEDYEHLVHPSIGLPTCVRIRREWAVRVRDSGGMPAVGDPDHRSGHSYYILASLRRNSGNSSITDLDIIDLRERRLLVPPASLVTDILGIAPEDYRKGLHRPPISLRTAINALLKGETPSIAPTVVASGGGNNAASDAAFEDSRQNFWAFFTSDRNGNQDIFLRRYLTGLQAWSSDEAVVSDPANDTDPIALEDSLGDVWLFWNTNRGASSLNIWSKRFRQANAAWDADVELVTSAEDDGQHHILEDNNTNLWLFWTSLRDAGSPTIWLNRYIRNIEGWEGERRVVTSSNMDQLPDAAVDGSGVIFLVWQSNRDGDDRIWWQRFNSNASSLGTQARLEPGAVNRQRSPRLLIDTRGNAWGFWRELISGKNQIRCARYDSSTGTWITPDNVTADSFDNRDPTPVLDGQGNIWVFWRSARAGGEVLMYRIFNAAADNWGTERTATTAPGDYILKAVVRSQSGAIWAFWTEQTSPTTTQAYYRQFFPVI